MRALGASRTSVVPGGVLAGPWVRNELWRRARAVPSLDLRFADDKSLTDAVTGQSLITFTRASSATFINSAGTLQTAATDVPRFDHNPTTGESLGLLVEEQRTNLLLRSEEFDNASWSKPQSDTITANSIASPTGATTADSFVENTASGAVHTLLQDGTIVANSTNSFSCFFKSAGRTQIVIKLSSTDEFNGCTGTFDLSVGTAAAVNFGTGSGATASIQAFPSGWYRCVINGNIGSALTTVRLRIRPLSGGNEIYTGNGATAYYIWGAQLEAGAFPTSYIPTTTAAATRSADVASITGANFSSWYRQDEGTVFADFRLNGIASQNKVVNADAGAGFANSVDIYCITGIPRFDVWESSTAQAQLSTLPSSSIGVNVDSRTIGSYKLNDFAATRNGGTLITDAAGITPTTTRLVIGSQSASNYLNGTIRRLTFFPQRLANSTLQAITQ